MNDNDGEVFDYPGTNDDNNARKYLESIGWVIDSNGKLQEGKRPGSDIGATDYNMIYRPYMAFLDARDLTFGVQFSF